MQASTPGGNTDAHDRTAALYTVLLMAFSSVSGAAILPATIDRDMTLTAADSPWELRSDAPVIFNAATAVPAPGDWRGVEYAPGSSGRLVNAILRNAQIGINVQSDGWIQLRDTTVHHCSEEGIRAGGASAPRITGCTVRDNNRWGVSVCHNAEPLLGASGSGSNPGRNTFVNNAQYDRANQTPCAIVAQDNWWGHSAQAKTGARIFRPPQGPIARLRELHTVPHRPSDGRVKRVA